MENSTMTATTPRMMTIRAAARTGILTENAIRRLVKTGECPHIMCGNRAMVNYDALVKKLEGC